MGNAAQAEQGAQVLRAGDRVPPHREDAERAVLGCVLQDSARVLDLCVEQQISGESFYVQTYRTVFEAMLSLYSARKPVDLVTVVDALRERQQLEGVGGEEELVRLIDGTPTTAHAEYYIKLLYDSHLTRRIIDTARVVTEECYRKEQEAESILNNAEESFFSLSEKRIGNERTWGELIEVEIAEAERLIQEKKGLTGISSGFERIDEMLLGFQNSDLIILAARPSMGKTALALNIAENIALGARRQPPRAVAVFSLEMSAESLVRRMLCCRAEVSSQALSRGQVGRKEHGQLIEAADALRQAPIYVDDTAGLEALDLRARARRLKRRYGIDFIVVDYLQLMNFSKFANEGRQRETSAISQALKGMAKELKVPVLVLSQLSRAPETRDPKEGKPKLSDLRDSGAIEQDADVVMLLRRPAQQKSGKEDDQVDPRLAYLEIAKHRNGPTGMVYLDFEAKYTRFSNRFEGVDPAES